jgi:hypothetical protein
MKSSDYFEKAITGPWTEAQTGIFKLVTEKVEVFKLFVQWLYIRRIEAVNTHDLQDFLVEAWCCGERLQAREFKNVVISMLFWDWAPYRHGYPKDYAIAALAYENSPYRSPLRKLVIDKFSAHANKDMLHSRAEELPFDLLADLTQRMLTNVATFNETGLLGTMPQARLEGNICQLYHEHAVEAPLCTMRQIKASYRMLHENSDLSEMRWLAPFEFCYTAKLAETT